MIIKGQKINDRYEIVRNIGEGGMANVYLAIDTILNRKVAVKILRGDLATDEKFVRKFQREASAASGLDHPNIVGIYDVGEDDGNYYIVMEYVEGRTLKSLIKRRGALTLSEVIDIMTQLTSGIDHAHEKGIIHRDIKPQNVLILDDGLVKIADFGIAHALNSNELTQTNSVMGSVHYLPPEQANGGNSSVKSDIYSLGILMFELVTGKVPFKGENAVEIVIKQMKDPIPSVCDINESIPQSVEYIILKATAKNPKNRYDSVLEMKEDIISCLDEERKNEPKIMFRYPEFEKDDEIVGSRVRRNEDKANLDDEEEIEENKKSNKTAFIIGGIIALLVALILFFVLILPNKSSKTIEIPDVSNMSISEATKKLEKLGLKVNPEDKTAYDDTIEEDYVIKTTPRAGKSLKEGATITLVVSLGKEGIEAENYVGKNYLTEKAILEGKGITVNIEKEEHQKDDSSVKENIILKQDVEEGTKLVEGDTITFTIAEFITVYPDFVNEVYTVEQVEDFCKENGVTLVKKEKETSTEKEGTILYQSRKAGDKVVNGVTLTITVAKKPVVTTPQPDLNNSTNNNTNSSNTNSGNTNSDINTTENNTNQTGIGNN